MRLPHSSMALVPMLTSSPSWLPGSSALQKKPFLVGDEAESSSSIDAAMEAQDLVHPADIHDSVSQAHIAPSEAYCPRTARLDGEGGQLI